MLENRGEQTRQEFFRFKISLDNSEIYVIFEAYYSQLIFYCL